MGKLVLMLVASVTTVIWRLNGLIFPPYSLLAELQNFMTECFPERWTVTCMHVFVLAGSAESLGRVVHLHERHKLCTPQPRG